MQHEILIDRVLALLAYMSEREAVEHLVESGVDFGEAFLAARAADVLTRVYPIVRPNP
jgi:hypothetical protein